MAWTSHPVVTLLTASIQGREVAGNKTSPFGKNVHFIWITCPVTLPRAGAELWAAPFTQVTAKAAETSSRPCPTHSETPTHTAASTRNFIQVFSGDNSGWTFSSVIRGVTWCSFYIRSRISPRVLYTSYWPRLIPSGWCAEILCTSPVPHLSPCYCHACTLANSFGNSCR